MTKTSVKIRTRIVSKTASSNATTAAVSKTATSQVAKKKYKSTIRKAGKYWRLVIPHLDTYPRHPPRNHEGLKRLKRLILDQLSEREIKRSLTYWCVAWQTHPGTGYAHMDIFLAYSKKVQNSFKRYDYLLKHGYLTRYRTLNRAILEYGQKEDSEPLSNLGENMQHILLEADVKADIYPVLQRAMLKNPFDFDAHHWLHVKDLTRAAAGTNWPKNISMVRAKRVALCNAILREKPGIQVITRESIQSRLSPDELTLYDSWKGYQTIVDHFNQIPLLGCNRPHKTSNLFVSGRPNTGKTTLAMQLEKYCAVYPLGTKGGWFPSFTAGVYPLMVWDEFNLRTLPYSDLLKLLEGRPMELPVKGGHAKRFDNQLIYMNSNLTLDKLICLKFKKTGMRNISRANLAPRIMQVKIPENLDLFVLLKLIVPANERTDSESPGV